MELNLRRVLDIMKSIGQHERSKQFLILFTENQKRLFSYILSLVPQRFDAEDIMQQTVLEMWGKFDQYKTGTNFLAWGITFAKFLILKHRNKHHKPQVLPPEMFDLILGQTDRFSKHTQNHTQALQNCIEKLGVVESRIIRLRYEEGYQITKVADTLGQTANVIYKSLAKIHTSLLLCIRRTLAERGVS